MTELEFKSLFLTTTCTAFLEFDVVGFLYVLLKPAS